MEPDFVDLAPLLSCAAGGTGLEVEVHDVGVESQLVALALSNRGLGVHLALLIGLGTAPVLLQLAAAPSTPTAAVAVAAHMPPWARFGDVLRIWQAHFAELA